MGMGERGTTRLVECVDKPIGEVHQVFLDFPDVFTSLVVQAQPVGMEDDGFARCREHDGIPGTRGERHKRKAAQ